MSDNTVVGLRSILLRSWLPPRLVLLIATASLALGGNLCLGYFSQLYMIAVGVYVLAVAIDSILAAIIIYWCWSVYRYSQLRHAAIRGDATRSYIVELGEDSSDEAPIEIRLKYPMSNIWLPIGILLLSVAMSGFEVYFTEMSKQSPSLLKDFELVALAFDTLMLLHFTLYYINRSRLLSLLIRKALLRGIVGIRVVSVGRILACSGFSPDMRSGTLNWLIYCQVTFTNAMKSPQARYQSRSHLCGLRFSIE